MCIVSRTLATNPPPSNDTNWFIISKLQKHKCAVYISHQCLCQRLMLCCMLLYFTCHLTWALSLNMNREETSLSVNLFVGCRTSFIRLVPVLYNIPFISINSCIKPRVTVAMTKHPVMINKTKPLSQVSACEIYGPTQGLDSCKWLKN